MYSKHIFWTKVVQRSIKRPINLDGCLRSEFGESNIGMHFSVFGSFSFEKRFTGRNTHDTNIGLPNFNIFFCFVWF